MTFATPWALLCLAAVPLAVMLHVYAQRRRPRYPVRFPALSTLAAVVAAQPRWPRHVPVALLALALAALTFSLARPQRTIAVPVEEATVVLVMDVSRSMSATDVAPSRLQAAQNAAQSFIEQVPGRMRIGLVAYSLVPQTLQTPTTDHKQVSNVLKTLQPISGTATGAGLKAALDDLNLGDDPSARRPPAAILLLSDGHSDDGDLAYEVALEAKRQRVKIFTVALGTPDGTLDDNGQPVPVPPDPEALKRIASLSGGEEFTAQDSDQLGNVYQRLGSQLGTKPKKQEITVAFAGAALLLLAGALGTSLSLNGRLP
jgi:Ca-activated chloride channel family protein